MLWETPLEVVYALEHAHLWIEGQNTQGRIKAEAMHDKLAEIRDRYDAKHK